MIRPLIQPRVRCEDVTTYYIINSRTKNTKHRQVIRRTWATPSLLEKSKSRIVFVIGMIVDSPRTHIETIEFESALYGDIIFADFVDSYENLSIKSAIGLQWVSSACDGVKYVGKIDDDIIINTYVLEKLMPSVVKHPAIHGVCMLSGYPHRNVQSKWYVSFSRYPHNYYGQFCLGAFMFMTRDTAIKLANVSREAQYFMVEAVYTSALLGTLAGRKRFYSSAEINLADENTKYTSMYLTSNKTEQFVYLTSSPAHMRNFWLTSHRRKDVCDSEDTDNIMFF